MTFVDRLFDAIDAALAWAMGFITLRRVGVATVIVVVVVGLLVWAFPCVTAHEGTCTLYCSTWTDGVEVRFPCGEYACDVCDERRFRWGRSAAAEGETG